VCRVDRKDDKTVTMERERERESSGSWMDLGSDRWDWSGCESLFDFVQMFKRIVLMACKL